MAIRWQHSGSVPGISKLKEVRHGRVMLILPVSLDGQIQDPIRVLEHELRLLLKRDQLVLVPTEVEECLLQEVCLKLGMRAVPNP